MLAAETCIFLSVFEVITDHVAVAYIATCDYCTSIQPTYAYIRYALPVMRSLIDGSNLATSLDQIVAVSP